MVITKEPSASKSPEINKGLSKQFLDGRIIFNLVSKITSYYSFT